MSSPRSTSGATVFKARTSLWFTGLAFAISAVGIASVLTFEGSAGLGSVVPLAAFAYVAWWLFWYPCVILDDSGVTLRNPLSTVQVPWPALIHVDTKYALKLVTPSGSFTAWAAPAPGVWGTHAGKPEHLTNLPGTSYGPGGSVRPGDLKHTDSGHAAYLVRSQWEKLLAEGVIDIDATDSAVVAKRINAAPILVGVLLIAGAAAAGVR